VRDSYHDDMDGPGLFILGVDILPTELAREATKHFGDALFPFVGALAGAKHLDAAPEPMKRAAIAADGRLTPLFEYITRMREHQAQRSGKELNGGPFSTVVRHEGVCWKEDALQACEMPYPNLSTVSLQHCGFAAITKRLSGDHCLRFLSKGDGETRSGQNDLVECIEQDRCATLGREFVLR
jgi:hypothetical protein